ncbi:MAG TPA: type I DNA topoisomerase [Armatimonadota bacterium]|nr:type I DNA topoisomerase [Armatimonadota bacterium]HQK94380.1 type I DNA topoisomerase [Armatimonadota bacterium]
MGKPLIIVESPTKVRTLSRFLGGRYQVASSSGHIRDLPKSTLGVDIAEGFRPRYRVLPDKQRVVRDLEKAAQKASRVFLASDPDREGEAIAWHIAQTLKLADADRIEFNEITPEAVERALAHPRKLDMARVDAYHARRVLDRLVGYELSPLLWRKVHRRGLSGGRVQSVALRLICEREREIQAFEAQEYWTIEAELTPKTARASFPAVMPFTKATRMDIGSEGEARSIVDEVRGAEWRVQSVRKAERKRWPRPPLITSTLQRAASARYGFSSQRTMTIAQSLYEGKDLGGGEASGLITYMRTDSVRVAQSAQEAAREYLAERFGPEYVPEKPPAYRTRRGAQDAHEAIRPTLVTRTPESVAPFLTADELKLYRLIWEAFLASQMPPAVLDTVTVDIAAGPRVFRASGYRVRFPGYMALQPERAPAPSSEKRAEAEPEDEAEENGAEHPLPELEEGQVLELVSVEPSQHFTQPPPRYTEAALISALEERGIGRPSTYAPTVEVIKARRYALIEDKRFRPTPLGFAVNDLLVQHFPDVVNAEFTAKMEGQLDAIEEEGAAWERIVAEFWGPFETTLKRAQEEMQDVRLEPEKVGRDCPECGAPLVLRHGRFGEFVGCSAYPECSFIEREAEAEQPTDEICEKCGRPMVRKRGRFGFFLGCSGYPECQNIRKPDRKPAQPTDIPCPNEGCDGHLVLRQARRGNSFYGCSRYPKCRFTSSKKPVGRKCPKCGEQLVQAGTDEEPTGVECSARGCDYQESAEAS